MSEKPITDFEEYLIDETENQKIYRFENDLGVKVYFGPDIEAGYNFEITCISFDKDGNIEIYAHPSFRRGFICYATSSFWLNTILKRIKRSEKDE